MHTRTCTNMASKHRVHKKNLSGLYNWQKLKNPHFFFPFNKILSLWQHVNPQSTVSTLYCQKNYNAAAKVLKERVQIKDYISRCWQMSLLHNKLGIYIFLQPKESKALVACGRFLGCPGLWRVIERSGYILRGVQACLSAHCPACGKAGQ